MTFVAIGALRVNLEIVDSCRHTASFDFKKFRHLGNFELSSMEDSD